MLIYRYFPEKLSLACNAFKDRKTIIVKRVQLILSVQKYRGIAPSYLNCLAHNSLSAVFELGHPVRLKQKIIALFRASVSLRRRSGFEKHLTITNCDKIWHCPLVL